MNAEAVKVISSQAPRVVVIFSEWKGQSNPSFFILFFYFLPNFSLFLIIFNSQIASVLPSGSNPSISMDKNILPKSLNSDFEEAFDAPSPASLDLESRVGSHDLSVPVYLSEMAPANRRGTLNIVFQFMIIIDILAANLVNYGTAKIHGGWGWRVSLAGAAVPSLLITIGSLCLPDTPNYLIERGHQDKARAVLRKIRGTDDIQEEF